MFAKIAIVCLAAVQAIELGCEPVAAITGDAVWVSDWSYYFALTTA